MRLGSKSPTHIVLTCLGLILMLLIPSYMLDAWPPTYDSHWSIVTIANKKCLVVLYGLASLSSNIDRVLHLSKEMQIKRLHHQCINNHHSGLPCFTILMQLIRRPLQFPATDNKLSLSSII